MTESAWDVHMRSLLGKKVEVLLSDEPLVTQIGTLHAFDEEGEVTLKDEAGVMHWCWPNLRTRSVE